MIAIRPEDDVSQIKPGSKIQLKMNGQAVITGYLDALSQVVTENSKEITVSGRDKTADLVDCAVIHKSYHFKNQTLQQIAETICQPFGIKVVWQATEPGANEKINVWQVEPGETAFDTISNAWRVFIYTTSKAMRRASCLDDVTQELVMFERSKVECFLKRFCYSHLEMIFIYQEE